MASGSSTAAQEGRLHRALASPVRRRVLELLTDAGPLDAHELADHVDLHLNTVRGHLNVLEDAGLVTSSPERRDRPGRPRLLYRATESTRPEDDRSSYRFLAEVLASQLSVTSDDPAAAGEAAGAAWGRYLVETPSPSTRVSTEAALAHVTELLAELGFAPERDHADPNAPRVLLHHCPFLDVAREHQDVVCSIHLGIMRGVLVELGADVEVTDLLPFVEPDRCVAHLRTPA